LSLAKEKEASESDDDMFFDRTKKAKKGHQSSQTKPVSAQDLIQEKYIYIVSYLFIKKSNVFQI